MKFFTVLVIVIGTVFIFNMAGFTTNSGAFVTGFLDNGFSYFTSSEFWQPSCESLSQCTSSIPTLLILGVTAGAIASLFGRSPDPTYVIGGVAFALMSILVIEMGALWAVISPGIDEWIKRVIGLTFLIETIALIATGISWWRGSDG